ncbi:MAG: hypothetical protein KA059_06270 [Elusimicrobiales bacterium]|nr:hypothetical protein [Elusimicrobiales bacterium]
MKKILTLYILLCCSIFNLYADDVKIFTPKEIKLGEKFSILFEIPEYNKEKIYISTDAITGSDFGYLSQTQNKNRVELYLIPFNIGISTFPEVNINIIDKSGIKTIKSYPVPLDIKPLFNLKETDTPKDIASVFDFLLWFKILIVILIIISIYFIIKYLMKKKRITTENIEYHKDTRTPYQRANDRIERLGSSNILDSGNIKGYYIALSNILRRYLDEEFQINALEMTTSDIIKRVKEVTTKIDILIKMRELLDTCDLVKFARYIPEKRKALKDRELLKEIVNMLYEMINEKRKKDEEERARLEEKNREKL